MSDLKCKRQMNNIFYSFLLTEYSQRFTLVSRCLVTDMVLSLMNDARRGKCVIFCDATAQAAQIKKNYN